MRGFWHRLTGSKQTSSLGIAGGLLGVLTAYQVLSPEQATALGVLLTAVGACMREGE